MNRDNPSCNWKLYSVMLLLFAPILFGLLFGSSSGLVHLLLDGRVVWRFVCLLFLPAYGVALMLLLRRGSVAWAFGLLFATAVGQLAVAGLTQEARVIEKIIIGGTPAGNGMDVFCNGVHLGTTPLTLTEAEFKSMVPQWDQPPEQPRVMYSKDADGNPEFHFSSSWTWTPANPFAALRDGPPDHFDWANEEEQLMENLKRFRYWWRFEQQGCEGLRSIMAMSGGGGGGLVRVYTVHPNVRIPSKPSHRDLILKGIRRLDYEAPPELVTHILKYRDLLFVDLAIDAKRDPRIWTVLDAVVSAHFQLDAEPDVQQAEDVLATILNTAESTGRFTVPSLESMAVARIAAARPQVVVDAFEREIPPASWHTQSGRAASTGWVSWHGPAEISRIQPLIEAARRSRPDALFERLIFLHGRQIRMFAPVDPRIVAMIGNYRDRPESEAIVRAYLERNRKSDGRNMFEQRTVLKALADIDNPWIEDHIRICVNDMTQRTKHLAGSGLTDFIESRIERHPNDAEFANWILFATGLTDEQKCRYLARIQHERSGQYLWSASRELSYNRRRRIVESTLRANPNSHAGRFLVEVFAEGRKLHPNTIHTAVNIALLQADHELVRKLIEEALDAVIETGRLKATQGPQERIRTAESELAWDRLVDVTLPVGQPHLNWLVSKLEDVESEFVRRSSIRLLKAIHTTDSKAVLQKWADDTENSAAASAKKALIAEAKQKSDTDAEVQRFNRLIAGDLHPNELAPEPQAFVWDGKRYAAKAAKDQASDLP